MKTRKLWAVPGLLLALCLLLALPAGAEETGKTVRVTCEYPGSLCTFTVRDSDTEQTWPLDSDIPYDEGKDYVWLDFKIGDIAEGYRIKSVRMNGEDQTEGFANGSYGFLSTYIRADTHIQVELEETPASLPSVAGVVLYTDAALTREAPAQLTYESGSTADRLYGKGTYSDSGSYPSYYAAGQWEFSTDGETWLPTRTWGNNRWDFWPGWEYHTELDFVNASYDMRLRVTPNNRYTSGGEVLSNVVHINGGAAGGAKEPVRLANPTDLTWGRYRPDDTVDFAYSGMIAWKEDTSQPEHTTEIAVYRKGENGAADEPLFESGHIVRTGSALWRDEHDFVNNLSAELENGVYYFTLQARGDGETCTDSDTVRSGEWTYTVPGRQIEAPAGLKWDWPNAVWDPSADPGAGGYIVDYYYSADNAGVTDPKDARRVGGYVWYFSEGGQTASEAIHDITRIRRFLSNGAGYYYFRARTLSADVLAAKNSEPSALSAACYYDGREMAAAPADLRWGTDAEGNSRPGCMSWTAGADQDFLSFDIEVLDGAGKQVYLAKSEYCETDGKGRWCSMLLSYLDEGLLPGGEPLPAGDYSFRVRASRNGEPLSGWSKTSGVYRYTPPSQRLGAPAGARWAGLYPLMTWTEAADRSSAFGYYVRYYFSADDGAAKDTGGLTEASGTLHMSLDGNGLTDNSAFVNDLMGNHGAGYYYFTVQAVSGDRDHWLNSPESPLSDAVHYDGQKVINGGTEGQLRASGVKTAPGGKISFAVSSSLYSSKKGSLFLAGWRNGLLSDAAYTTKQKGEFSLDAETAKVFFLEEETFIPLAKAVQVAAD